MERRRLKMRGRKHVYESMDENLSGDKFIITNTPHSIVRKGFPLDSLSKEIESGRYYYDLDEKEADKLVEYSAFAELFRGWGMVVQAGTPGAGALRNAGSGKKREGISM